jgi:hypothetical protein
VIYLIGGAPRAGKSILGKQVAAKLNIGWMSTDLLMELLRVKNEEGVKTEWNANPEAIKANAVWFLPYLERLIWVFSSLAEDYLVEGADFLPAQVSQLSKQYQLRSVFVGCSEITLERLDQFLGRSPGYAFLSEEMKRQVVHDVPLWSDFIRQEAERFGFPYVDTSDDFSLRLQEAEAILTTNIE